MLNLNSLNPQQRLAVETIHGPVLILAGAGTGKTRVITFRIAYLIEKGVAPENILAVTFTNKAAREMKERVLKLIPRSRNREKKTTGPTLCTFHSLGARILRKHIHLLGYKTNFVIYDDSEQVSAIKKILSHISARGEKPDPKDILARISKIKNGVKTDDVLEDPLLRLVWPRYENSLRACNALDFDDLLGLTLKLFNEHKDVLEGYRKSFRFIMVDEYQDTNAAQFEIVKLLTQEHRNLCVVGDDDQSIYGWRGAEIANLLDLDKHFREVKVVKLEQNYRSTNTILDAANAVIKNNTRRRAKKLWSQNGQGNKILLQGFETDEEEARTVVEEIEFTRLTHRVPWQDFAILFRTNQQSRPLEIALRQAGVKYRLIGGQSYFDRREIRDVLAYLKTLHNPHDDVSLLRIANVPARGLSDATMQRLLAASQERQCSVFSAMRHTDVQAGFSAKTREAMQAFLALLEHKRAQLHSGESFSLSSWAEQLFQQIGYVDELRRSEKDPQTAENRVRNIKELLLDLEQEGNAHLPAHERLSLFLEELMLDKDREEEEQESNGVTLITMHSCKGLEFPRVYIVGLEDGLLPHTRSKEEGTIDEERRLFYVAITRARQALSLSYCAGRKRYGQLMPCHRSRFLSELPEELVEDAAQKSKQPVPASAGKKLFSAMREVVK